MYKVISIVGPPGAGKGTQSSKLIKELGFSYCSIGDALREQSKSDPELKEMLKTGHLLPIEIIERVFTQMLKSKSTPLLLDGVPRNKEQIFMVERALLNIGLELDLVIFLDIEDRKVVNRLSNRWLCIEGDEKHLLSGRKEDLINKCSGELIRREDDNPETIKKRLQVYHSETAYVLDHYIAQNKVYRVDADQPIEKVFKDIKERISI